MHKVKDILAGKGSEIWGVSPEDTVYSALEFLSQKQIGAVLVLEEGKLHGIFSERDYARKVILAGKSSRELKVKEIMSKNVICVEEDQTVEECMALMTEKHIRHLPVYSGGKLSGVISIGDVVKAIIKGKEHEINELTRYITEGR